MKKLLIPAIIVFICGGAALAQPKIQADGGTTLELGDVFKGSKAERLVSIRNAGSDTLKISEVKAQCGCTAAMMATSQIAPANSGKLSISFDTRNYDGKVTKQVYVSSNDPSTPKLTISFNVNVITILDASPKWFSFDNSKVDSTYTKTLTLTNPTHEALRILSVKPTGQGADYMKVDLMKRELMPGEQTQLQASLHATKSGTFNGQIELMTDNKTQPKFEIKYFEWITRK